MVMCSQPTGEPRRTNKYVNVAYVNGGETLVETLNVFLNDVKYGKIKIESILIRYTNEDE